MGYSYLHVIIIALSLLITLSVGEEQNNHGWMDLGNGTWMSNRTWNSPISFTKFRNRQIESLCSRIHNNTAYLGSKPKFSVKVDTARQCRDICLDQYPSCKAVIFYRIADAQDSPLCYLFNKTSVDKDVVLYPEKPLADGDIIRVLEIVADCHEFDAVPPLSDAFIASSDKVSRSKRASNFGKPIKRTGPWTPWTKCRNHTSKYQIRSQKCEYGRIIQKRQCPLEQYSGLPSFPYPIPYPPYPPLPYHHPDQQSLDYERRLAEHQAQLRRSHEDCCERQQWYREHVNKTHITFCRHSCPPPESFDTVRTVIKMDHFPTHPYPEFDAPYAPQRPQFFVPEDTEQEDRIREYSQGETGHLVVPSPALFLEGTVPAAQGIVSWHGEQAAVGSDCQPVEGEESKRIGDSECSQPATQARTAYWEAQVQPSPLHAEPTTATGAMLPEGEHETVDRMTVDERVRTYEEQYFRKDHSQSHDFYGYRPQEQQQQQQYTQQAEVQEAGDGTEKNSYDVEEGDQQNAHNNEHVDEGEFDRQDYGYEYDSQGEPGREQITVADVPYQPAGYLDGATVTDVSSSPQQQQQQYQTVPLGQQQAYPEDPNTQVPSANEQSLCPITPYPPSDAAQPTLGPCRQPGEPAQPTVPPDLYYQQQHPERDSQQQQPTRALPEDYYQVQQEQQQPIRAPAEDYYRYQQVSPQPTGAAPEQQEPSRPEPEDYYRQQQEQQYPTRVPSEDYYQQQQQQQQQQVSPELTTVPEGYYRPQEQQQHTVVSANYYRQQQEQQPTEFPSEDYYRQQQIPLQPTEAAPEQQYSPGTELEQTTPEIAEAAVERQQVFGPQPADYYRQQQEQHQFTEVPPEYYRQQQEQQQPTAAVPEDYYRQHQLPPQPTEAAPEQQYPSETQPQDYYRQQQEQEQPTAAVLEDYYRQHQVPQQPTGDAPEQQYPSETQQQDYYRQQQEQEQPTAAVPEDYYRQHQVPPQPTEAAPEQQYPETQQQHYYRQQQEQEQPTAAVPEDYYRQHQVPPQPTEAAPEQQYPETQQQDYYRQQQEQEQPTAAVLEDYYRQHQVPPQPTGDAPEQQYPSETQSQDYYRQQQEQEQPTGAVPEGYYRQHQVPPQPTGDAPEQQYPSETQQQDYYRQQQEQEQPTAAVPEDYYRQHQVPQQPTGDAPEQQYPSETQQQDYYRQQQEQEQPTAAVLEDYYRQHQVPPQPTGDAPEQQYPSETQSQDYYRQQQEQEQPTGAVPEGYYRQHQVPPQPTGDAPEQQYLSETQPQDYYRQQQEQQQPTAAVPEDYYRQHQLPPQPTEVAPEQQYPSETQPQDYYRQQQEQEQPTAAVPEDYYRQHLVPLQPTGDAPEQQYPSETQPQDYYRQQQEQEQHIETAHGDYYQQQEEVEPSGSPTPEDDYWQQQGRERQQPTDCIGPDGQPQYLPGCPEPQPSDAPGAGYQVESPTISVPSYPETYWTHAQGLPTHITEEVIAGAPGWSPWTTWSICPVTCGDGVQTRRRACHGGVECHGEASQERPCHFRPCGMWAEWCDWSACTATCGSSVRTRTRHCTSGEGQCHGNDLEVEMCDTTSLCTAEWTAWLEWTRCSVTCGGGIKKRYRRCPAGGCSGSNSDEMPCSLMACPFWSTWGLYTACSVSCGSGGHRSRRRICIGGDDCTGPQEERIACVDRAPCPEWSEWEDWSTCSKTCGYGFITRQRTCLGSPYCPGDRIEQKRCEHHECPFWGQWKEWSKCTATCGDGMKQRKRICQYGTDCPGSDEETIFCFTEPCSTWSHWERWSRCSADCGPGQKTRTRSCYSADGSPSEDCIGLQAETVLCFERHCCHWSPWSAYGACDRNCGSGKRHRERKCQRSGFEGEEDETCTCPGPDVEEDDCNVQACEPQCQWTHWYAWSSCTSIDPCKSGVTTRKRQCVGEAGCQCPGAIDEVQSCQTAEPCTLPPLPKPPITPCCGLSSIPRHLH